MRHYNRRRGGFVWWPSLQFPRFVVLAVMVALVMLPGVALAHLPGDEALYDKCIGDSYYGDTSCKTHWLNSKMTYRWGSLIDDPGHDGHRNSFVYGANTWEFATSPTVPWYESYSSSSATVVDVRNTNLSIGKALFAAPNGEFHTPRMLEIWLKHDVETYNCNGQPCSWYWGTGTPTQYQYDEWSSWAHELGHAQNVGHQSVDAHTTHDHTMRPTIDPGDNTKRTLSTHEKRHACKPYELSHGDIVCGAL